MSTRLFIRILCVGVFGMTFLGWSLQIHAAQIPSFTSKAQPLVLDPEIHVALAPGKAKKYTIASTLYLPSKPTNAVIVTYHGSTYGQYYWNFSYQPGTYSFVDAMTKAGYAILNMDRIGDGQ